MAFHLQSTHLQITEPCDLVNDCQTTPAYAKDLPAAGNLSTLVSLLASCKNEDMELAFILCARLFVPMQELLSMLIQQCHGQEDELLRLLSHWLRICPNDFRNETLLQQLRKQNGNKALSSFLDCLPDTLDRQDASRRSQLQYMLAKQASASSLGRQSSIKSLKRFAANVYKTDNVLTKCSSAFELAHQLYAIEYAYLSQLRLEEFIELISNGEFKVCMSQTKASTLGSHCTSAKQADVSIEAYVQWFNQLSSLTATEILKVSKSSTHQMHVINLLSSHQQLGKKSQRAQMIEFWIETALECFNIGNFNSLMAILTALNTTNISRLKKTVSATLKVKLLDHKLYFLAVV